MRIKFLALLFLFTYETHARECPLPTPWQRLCPILNSRILQKNPKMKLKEAQVTNLAKHLSSTHPQLPYLECLQTVLPKTTIELLFAIKDRGVSQEEAEKMAKYLEEITLAFQFQNVKAFDENTSHIIGRAWHEIDYSGEGMTWQKQKRFYAPYGIHHFKSLDCLQKFFPVESRLPYFLKIYKPKYPDALS